MYRFVSIWSSCNVCTHRLSQFLCVLRSKVFHASRRRPVASPTRNTCSQFTRHHWLPRSTLNDTISFVLSSALGCVPSGVSSLSTWKCRMSTSHAEKTALIWLWLHIVNSVGRSEMEDMARRKRSRNMVLSACFFSSADIFNGWNKWTPVCSNTSADTATANHFLGLVDTMFYLWQLYFIYF